jgi:hypothetical protein
MLAYVYQAALLCEECGCATRERLTAEGAAPQDSENESTFDSGDFPKGPYPYGGGEADTPQHCDACGVFLENSLTADGESYVKEAIETSRELKRKNMLRDSSVALEIWAPFYEVES